MIMKKTLLTVLLIIMWWLLSGILSVPIVNLSPERCLISNQRMLNLSGDINMLVVMIPFILANAIGALIVAAMARIANQNISCCKLGLLLALLGATPFVILTSYKDNFF